MEYRSPLGYNFKLEESLSASKEEENKETPKKNDSISNDNSGTRKPSFGFDNRKNSRGGRNSHQDNSPNWQRHSNNWKSPNPKNSQEEESVPITQFYHPSMLENPWEEFEEK